MEKMIRSILKYLLAGILLVAFSFSLIRCTSSRYSRGYRKSVKDCNCYHIDQQQPQYMHAINPWSKPSV